MTQPYCMLMKQLESHAMEKIRQRFQVGADAIVVYYCSFVYALSL